MATLSTNKHESSFVHDAEGTLARLQRSLLECIERLTPVPSRAPDLGRALALDKSLAWKLHRLAYEPAPLHAAQYIPGEAGLAIAMRAFAACGVERANLDALRTAIDDYRELVARHGGDRGSLQMMLSARSTEDRGASGDDRTQLGLRQSAFRASSYMAGVQAATQLQAYFVAPSADLGLLDLVIIRGYVGVRRLRPRAPFILTRLAATDDQGRLIPIAAGEPLSSAAPGDSLPSEERELGWLPEFSSGPPLRFARGRHGPRHVEYELSDGPVGNTGAFTYFFGEVRRASLPSRAATGNTQALYAAQLRTPARAALLDVFMHRDAFGTVDPTVAQYSELHGEEMLRGPGRERFRLPTEAVTEQIDVLPGGAATPDVPRYAALLIHVFDTLRWRSSDFRLIRSRIAVPFVPSALVMTHDLPAGNP